MCLYWIKVLWIIYWQLDMHLNLLMHSTFKTFNNLYNIYLILWIWFIWVYSHLNSNIFTLFTVHVFYYALSLDDNIITILNYFRKCLCSVYTFPNLSSPRLRTSNQMNVKSFSNDISIFFQDNAFLSTFDYFYHSVSHHLHYLLQSFTMTVGKMHMGS